MPIPIGTDHPLERTPWATISIIAVTILSQYLDLGTGEWLIPIPIFQHADVIHLFGNMLFLWIFGSYLEAKIGWLRFVLFYFLCELGSEFVFVGLFGGEGIGASGAISGIMALYLARFYHARIRTIFWLGPFPIRYSIPVMFLVPSWFVMDLVFGVLGMTEVTNTAYFAHVGGFLTGLIIAKVMKFDVEGRSEHFKQRAAGRMDEREELPRAVADLKRALAVNYDDPETHLLLGRCYARSSDNHRLARKYYLQSIDMYARVEGNARTGAAVYLEMLKKLGGAGSPEEFLKFAVVFEVAGDHEGAATLLSQAMERGDLAGEAGKKVLAKLGSNARAAGNIDLAERAEERFKDLFPGVEFPKPAARPAVDTLVLPTSREQVGKRAPSLWKWLDEMMQSAMFWILWSLIFLPVALFMEYSLAESIGDASIFVAIIVPTLIAATATHFYLNSGEMAGNFVFGTGYRKTEHQAARDFNIASYFNKGMAAEREERFEEAVTYYKGVLVEDPKHIEARFRLARIYLRNLNRKGSAIYEFENLLESAPQGNPYYREAEETLEALRAGKPFGPKKIEPLEFKQ